MSVPEETSQEVTFAPASQKQWLRLLLAFGLSAAVVFVLVHHFAGAGRLLRVLRGVAWGWLLLPVALVLFNLNLAVLRWRVILRAVEVRLPYGRGVEAVFGTWPLALLTPSRASDLLRALAIADVAPGAQGVGSVVAEKVIDVFVLSLLTMLGGAVSGLWLWCGVGAAFVVVGCLGLWLLLTQLDRLVHWFHLHKLEPKIKAFFSVFSGLLAHPRYLLLAGMMSFLAWMVAMTIIFTLARLMGAALSLGQVVTLWPLALFIGQLPLTVAGVGTRDAAFLSLVWMVSAAPPEKVLLLAATLSYAVLTTALPALLGLPWMIRWLAKQREKKRKDAEA